ncbi:hypothetical protein CHS0354_026169 [Potamilus streckersoni]|uniref:Reverse transcriptase zinc-binding domain-containing protein n=1 Tax=Potamilus streckersoni TaxID=2493646 RepID=A0AAE0SB05_9BIVA|nr:hypothetical protein CHS0354_026169 [Potamilus streckersoni]
MNYTTKHQLQPNVSRHPPSVTLNCRRHHIIINRLQTGKTLLQSSLGKHLKDRRHQTSTCTHCRERETLQHIFNDCTHYHLQRLELQRYQQRIGAPYTYQHILSTKDNPNLKPPNNDLLAQKAAHNKDQDLTNTTMKGRQPPLHQGSLIPPPPGPTATPGL